MQRAKWLISVMLSSPEKCQNARTTTSLRLQDFWKREERLSWHEFGVHQKVGWSRVSKLCCVFNASFPECVVFSWVLGLVSLLTIIPSISYVVRQKSLVQVVWSPHSGEQA